MLVMYGNHFSRSSSQWVGMMRDELPKLPSSRSPAASCPDEFAPPDFAIGFDWDEIYHHDPIAPRHRPDRDRRVNGARYRATVARHSVEL